MVMVWYPITWLEKLYPFAEPQNQDFRLKLSSWSTHAPSFLNLAYWDIFKFKRLIWTLISCLFWWFAGSHIVIFVETWGYMNCSSKLKYHTMFLTREIYNSLKTFCFRVLRYLLLAYWFNKNSHLVQSRLFCWAICYSKTRVLLRLVYGRFIIPRKSLNFVYDFSCLPKTVVTRICWADYTGHVLHQKTVYLFFRISMLVLASLLFDLSVF